MPTLHSCPPSKQRLGTAFRASGLSAAAFGAERLVPSLRVLNYHSVPERFATSFKEQLRQLRPRFRIGGPEELPELVVDGVDRPTLILCFDDGLRNTVEIAAPILEEGGTRAIFAVPAAWPDVPSEEQPSWFREHVYPAPTELHNRTGDVEAASWGALRALVDRGHQIWSHGLEHVQIRPDTPPETVHREIEDSRAILEEKLGAHVLGYCPPVAYNGESALANRAIADTYELAFTGSQGRVRRSTDLLHIPRINIEASWPWPVVAFQLTRLGDSTSVLRARMRR